MKFKPLAVLAFLVLAAWPLSGRAQVFEVIHPDIVKGGFEIEILNGFVLDSVEEGDERTAHELAIAYAPLDFWKTKAAIEIANPRGEPAEYEAFEWKNIFAYTFGEGHHHGHSHDHGEHGFFAFETIGLFTKLEVPNDGGLGSGAFEVGPIAEAAIGPVTTVANFFFEFPFEDEEGAGIAYALEVKYPVLEQFSVGFEAYGEVENAFRSESEDEHFIGPALYSKFDLGRDRILLPRLAFLFGLTEDAPDATASLNFELKF